jgi:hypothetical protein
VRPPATIRSAWQNRPTPRCRGATMSASDTFVGRRPPPTVNLPPAGEGSPKRLRAAHRD